MREYPEVNVRIVLPAVPHWFVTKDDQAHPNLDFQLYHPPFLSEMSPNLKKSVADFDGISLGPRQQT